MEFLASYWWIIVLLFLVIFTVTGVSPVRNYFCAEIKSGLLQKVRTLREGAITSGRIIALEGEAELSGPDTGFGHLFLEVGVAIRNHPTAAHHHTSR